jgi:TonB family protein
MVCLWPSTMPTLARSVARWLGVFIVLACMFSRSGFAGSILAPPVIAPSSLVTPNTATVKSSSGPLATLPVHISEFLPVWAPLDVPRCGTVQPPEALLTPDPLRQTREDDSHVRVSFIVGTDGHVHSAFVLESGGMTEDQMVLRAVRLWRYRPALCNGVPTDFEALVRFNLR